MRDFSRPTPAILHSRRSLRCSLILRAQALSTDNRQKSLLNALSNHRPNANDLVDFPGPSPHFFGGKFSDFTRCVSCYIYLCVRFTTSIICRCLQKQGDQFESLRPLHFDGNPDTSVVSGFLVSISHDLVRTKTALCENKDADHADVSASRRTHRADLSRTFLLHCVPRPNPSRALPLGDALLTPERTNFRPPEGLCCVLRLAGLGLQFEPLGSVVRLVLLRMARPSFMWSSFSRCLAP